MNGSALLEILNFKYSHLICIFDILKLKISICLLSHIVPNVHFIKSEFANLHFVIIPLIISIFSEFLHRILDKKSPTTISSLFRNPLQTDSSVCSQKIADKVQNSQVNAISE